MKGNTQQCICGGKCSLVESNEYRGTDWRFIHFDNNRVPVGQFHPTEDRHARSEIFDSATNSRICSDGIFAVCILYTSLIPIPNIQTSKGSWPKNISTSTVPVPSREDVYK